MEKTRIHESYKPLYTSNKRYFLLTGGRASLKSTTIHDFASRLTYQKGHGILVTRYTMASAEKSIIPEFETQIKRNGSFIDFHKKGNLYTNKRTGSFILFSGIKTSQGDQTANLKSLAGITTWIVDEGEDFTDEATFDDIDDSIRSSVHQNRVIWVQNPSTKEHFIYGRWIEPHPKQIEVEGVKIVISNHPDVEAIHTTYHIAEEMGYLSKSFLHKIEKIKKDKPDKFKHKYIGGWLDKAEGVIFEDWEHGEWDNSLPYCYGLDFGYEDEDALVKTSVDTKRKRIYVQELLYKNNLGSDTLAEILLDRVGHKDMIIGDAAAKRLINDLWHKGLNIRRCKKGAGSVQRGIKTIQGYTIIVCGESPNLVKSLNNYVWHDKRSGVPRHEWSHLMDALRYSAMELIEY